MTLKLLDEFSGVGGSTEGATKVKGVEAKFAANHNVQAVESHAANHPTADHYLGDIQAIQDVGDYFPPCDLFWSSPACPAWTDARGVKRTFDKVNQLELWAEQPTEDELKAMRSRALMEEVVRYLRAMHDKGKPVLAGVVENVIQCRKWADWDRWIREIEALGYEVKVIAFNSMHAAPRSSRRAPQSRCRLYVGYWRKSLKRRPDWDKWLRPKAYCPRHDGVVDAVQVFKNPKTDMGRYRSQYVYQCPQTSCRGQVVEPGVLPAAAAIDWSIPGQRIGDRDKPLADKTIARIQAGLAKYARPITLEAAGNTFERRPGVRTWPVDAPITTQTTTATKALAIPPLLVPAGGTWRNEATPVTDVMGARTTRENDALVIPPLLVPVEGRDGKEASPADAPLRTQTTRNETGLAWLPFITPMRGGGDAEKARPVTDPLHAVTAGGNHHGLVAPPAAIDWETILVPYYGNGNARPVSEPIGTLSTRDRYAVVNGIADIDLDDVMFRMLEPAEIQAAMAFPSTYLVLPEAKRDKVRLLGNAVTPPVAEIIISALVEAITGEDLERAA
ncbi:DNA cytosine methyltransferase [Nonomuraea sp. NPDC048901]|uniref:DNA cytosine methyltransferase n=1 Tax=Nonomuraea sp. NPDC048901 TaxID=3155627 RepID=UPI0033C9807E